MNAAGCLLPGFVGLEAPPWLRDRLERGLGGVCLFSRNIRDPEQLAALTEQLRAAREDVVIGVDEEGGDVTRLEHVSGSSYPGAWALGVVDDVALTERVAAAIGGDLARAGVNLDFAPVADVNTNPDNPIIGIRAFGADPALVARHVAAFVRGLQATGVAACAKHFPGHGDTSQDSHHELPTMAPDAAVLEASLEPFRAAVNAGVRAVMTAHIRVPALDEAPATLSRTLVDGVLRGELGFGGAVVTDALEMRAVSATVGVDEGAVRALAAGADALLLGHDLGPDALDRVEAALVAAVRAGRLAEERLAEAATRVAALGTHPEPLAADPLVGPEAARRALVADGDVRLQREPFVVELVPPPSVAAGPAEHGLGPLLGARRPGTQVVALGASNGFPEIGRRQLVLVLRDAHRHPWQRRLAELLLAGTQDAVVIDTGLPGPRPPSAGYVATHGAGRVNLEAAVERLLG